VETALDHPSEPIGGVALGAGPIAALIVAGLLSHVRSDVGTANVALVLACVVVGAALAGRLAGAATAVTAAVAYDYFHTRPYYTLRIHASRDVVTVALLLLIGLAVSEASAWRRRANAAASRRHRAASDIEAVAAALAAGGGASDLWPLVETTVVSQLHLRECRFELGPATTFPVVPRSGSLTGTSVRFRAGAVQLPLDGAAIAVAAGGHVLGHLVLLPDPDRGSDLEARRVAVAVADLYAVALAREAGPVFTASPAGTGSPHPSR
jgi:K+-sensing histidine kinase KdpD